MPKTVVVGMSGGVDSSVAAYLLKKEGYNVIGVFMHNWEEEQGGFCTAEQDYEDVRRVCSSLSIPYYSVNFSKQYYKQVFEYFLQQYSVGLTPNPDVLCNREIKFGPFLDYALKIGADYIATGHYCGSFEKGGKYYLTKAADISKDQSYFLHQLNQHQLSKTLFPLSGIDKSEVREIARTLELSTAKKKDSTGICFIGERNFREFLSKYLPAQPGDIIDNTGKKVGTHMGVMYYTLGQRKGLGIGGVADGGSGRWFVYDKDVDNNILYVQQGSEERLYSGAAIIGNVNFIPEKFENPSFECYAKFRYRQSDQAVSVNMLSDNRLRLDFLQRQRAVTRGQYAVLYNGGICLGGGVIEEVFY